MILRNSLNFINKFFVSISDQIRSIYLNSNYYDKKISKISFDNLDLNSDGHLNEAEFSILTEKSR